MMTATIVDSTRADRSLRRALAILLDRKGERAADLRERFWFTLALHARDGGCVNHCDGECPAGLAADLVLVALS